MAALKHSPPDSPILVVDSEEPRNKDCVPIYPPCGLNGDVDLHFNKAQAMPTGEKYWLSDG